MAVTPMQVQRRPFSVEPFTKVMLPDGIFDTALKKQLITCFVTNTSGAPLNDVFVYLEGVGDPGIVPEPRSHVFAEMPAGASVRVSWLADFEQGTPGKKLISIVAQAAGMSLARELKHIFVTQTTYDSAAKEYLCRVEEGTLKVTHLEAIGPREEWLPCSERDRECRPTKGPWVPARMTATFYPNPPYAGVHGDLPFGDPWWKILGWIVFGVATLVSIIAAAMGAGTAGTAVSGEFDETTGDVDCCGAPEAESIPGADELTVAGVASLIAAGGMALGMADGPDVWWRGQEATPPATDEVTLSETVDVAFSYPGGAPQAGAPYPVDVSWRYERVTSGQTYSHAVEEQQTNKHLNGGVDVDVPAVHNAFAEPLVIKSRFIRESGEPFTGDDLYAFALLRSPDNVYFLVDLVDDGIDPDERADDGTYTGSIHLEEIYRLLLRNKLKLEGVWQVYVFAQDVNGATPDMLPEIAAEEIGGFMVASGLQLTFDPSLPCPLQSQATVTVVT